jgi:hypothetical protein
MVMVMVVGGVRYRCAAEVSREKAAEGGERELT